MDEVNSFFVLSNVQPKANGQWPGFISYIAYKEGVTKDSLAFSFFFVCALYFVC